MITPRSDLTKLAMYSYESLKFIERLNSWHCFVSTSIFIWKSDNIRYLLRYENFYADISFIFTYVFLLPFMMSYTAFKKHSSFEVTCLRNEAIHIGASLNKQGL